MRLVAPDFGATQLVMTFVNPAIAKFSVSLERRIFLNLVP